jgi:hypothetical protein
MQQLNRQASLESSANQQAAAYGAQSSQMIGQAVGAIGSFAAAGGFKNNTPQVEAVNQIQPVSVAQQPVIQPALQTGGNLFGATGLEGLRGMNINLPE